MNTEPHEQISTILSRAAPVLAAVLALAIVTLARGVPPPADDLVAAPQAATPQTHVPLPAEVRGIYWNAGTSHNARRVRELLSYMTTARLNAVACDVQYDNGVAAFPPARVMDDLRRAGIYRIARIAVMRNGAFAAAHSDAALRTSGNALWRDRIGSVWVDPADPAVADQALALGREAYARGFDEIQYDYIRFPSDGSTKTIRYPVYDGRKSKVAILQSFFKSVGGGLQDEGIPVSFDVFGMTFWSAYDFEIGQRLVDAAAYADFISPMSYPSHYPAGFEGFVNPATHPHDVVKRTLDHGALQLGGAARAKFRPWIQDFDLGASYGSAEVSAQIQAARDAGASGWLIWNARNVYSPLTNL